MEQKLTYQQTKPELFFFFGHCSCAKSTKEIVSMCCVIRVLLLIAVLSLTMAMQSAPLCEVVKDWSVCTKRRDCKWCSMDPSRPGLKGHCYDALKGSCCGQNGTDCLYPAACNPHQFCCLPIGECLWEGEPRCCEKGQTCCKARFGAACCNATQVCCQGDQWAFCCNASTSKCCHNTRGDPYCSEGPKC